MNRWMRSWPSRSCPFGSAPCDRPGIIDMTRPSGPSDFTCWNCWYLIALLLYARVVQGDD